MENPGRFIAIRFVVRWGWLFPWVAAVLSLAAGLAAGCFGTATGAAAVIAVTVLIWGGTRLAAEVVDLVAETLLPR
ncbi:MAG: hypothetical protein H7332_13670 [Bdellovibrionales bacterium]|nr:hypothetical protein [Ramlibacter sp.]